MNKKESFFGQKQEKKSKHHILEVIHQHRNLLKSGRHGKIRDGYIFQEGRGYK
ncbi:MAG: hypothetical protein HY934_01975 [Candidatus Firestonebacteria bacterium]|nr:hypothetical protein [Candidatus Firestonebacteria bacterium]